MQQTAILLRPFHATRWRSSRVEHLICNQAVVGSIPIASFEDASCGGRSTPSGEVPEWPKGADCKSAGVSLRRFESSPLHHPLRARSERRVQRTYAGIAQLVRASAFQAEGRGFESRFPLRDTGLRTRSAAERERDGCAQVAQSVEHVLGKDEVGGSIPLLGFDGAVRREPRATATSRNKQGARHG